MPAALRDAFIASEDRRFEWHPGVDPLAILRAAATNLRAGRVVSGASTLTQQLARLLVPRRRTIAGKAQEALWALRLTAHLSREDILRATWIASPWDTTWSRPPRRPTLVGRRGRCRWARPRSWRPSPAPRSGWTPGETGGGEARDA